MKAEAPVVVIGTVLAVGGSEPIYYDDEVGAQYLTVHRVRLAVETALRGEPGPVVDFYLWDSDPDPFVVGERYLVFAEPRTFGSRKLSGLAPAGYTQGVYRVVGSSQAQNDSNGAVNLDRLAAALRAFAP